MSTWVRTNADADFSAFVSVRLDLFSFCLWSYFGCSGAEEMEPVAVFNRFHTYEDNEVRIWTEGLSRTHVVANFISFEISIFRSHFTQDPWSTGAPPCDPSHPRGNGHAASFKKKQSGSPNERKTRQTWQRASCCSFNLLSLFYIKKNLLFGKAESRGDDWTFTFEKRSGEKESKGIYEIKGKHRKRVCLLWCVLNRSPAEELGGKSFIVLCAFSLPQTGNVPVGVVKETEKRRAKVASLQGLTNQRVPVEVILELLAVAVQVL